MSGEELPAGWALSRIGDLCELINGKAFKPSDWGTEGLPIIRIQNLNNVSAKFNYFAGDVAEKFIVEPGELLFAWSGTPGTSFGAHVWRGQRGVLNQHIFRVLFDANTTNNEFFRLAINQKLIELIGKAQGGVGLRHVTKGTFEDTRIVYPPLSEQCRVVEKIRVLTTRLSHAREALDTLPGLIDRYRQSILAAAFCGDLTADWRSERGEVQEGLPTGWAWKTTAEIIDEGPTNGYSPKAAPDGNGTASLRLSATTSGRMILDESTIKKLVEAVPADSKFWLRGGDILIQRANSLEHLGATAIYNGTERSFIYPDLMMRVRIADPSLRTYFWRYMNGRSARRWLKERATGTAGNMPKISGATLKELPVPVPPPGERAVINRRIDRAFAAIDRLEQAGIETEARLAALDQSILAKAFRGELVPQDPNDEPASALLERIRAERAAAGPAPRRGRRPKAAGDS